MLRRTSFHPAVISGLLLSAFAAPAWAQLDPRLTLVFSNLPGAANAAVPFRPGWVFTAGASPSVFGRVVCNGVGDWALVAAATSPGGAREVLIRNGATLRASSDVAPWSASETIGDLDVRVSLNADGSVAFATTSAGGPAATDRVLGMIDGELAFVPLLREGSTLPAPSNGETVGDTLDQHTLLDAGGVAAHARLTNANRTAFALFTRTSIVATGGVTVPTGQIAPPQSLAATFAFDFRSSGDASHWLADVALAGPAATNRALLVDGTVRVQKGVTLAGSGFVSAVAGTGCHGMNGVGHWMACGSNVDGADWTLRDGSLYLKTGDAVGDAGEHLDDRDFAPLFSALSINDQGETLVAAITDGAVLSNGVLVYDGAHVLVRENAPVDVDGDLQADDDTFIDAFAADAICIDDGGNSHFVATLRNAAGNVTGSGLFQYMSIRDLFANGFED